jgi:succinate dehydrogenase/fumarate reductase cytochrome b subunit
VIKLSVNRNLKSLKIDEIISILLLISGILIIIFWDGYFNSIRMAFYMFSSVTSMGSYGYPTINMPLWASAGYWIVILLGVTTMIYGIKRLIDNALKIRIIKNPPIPRNPQHD